MNKKDIFYLKHVRSKTIFSHQFQLEQLLENGRILVTVQVEIWSWTGGYQSDLTYKCFVLLFEVRNPKNQTNSEIPIKTKMYIRSHDVQPAHRCHVSTPLTPSCKWRCQLNLIYLWVCANRECNSDIAPDPVNVACIRSTMCLGPHWLDHNNAAITKDN